jgi:hypothetical protein
MRSIFQFPGVYKQLDMLPVLSVIWLYHSVIRKTKLYVVASAFVNYIGNDGVRYLPGFTASRLVRPQS